MKTKICGLNPTRDVQLCIDLKVNYLGFVFYEKSPRNINILEIKELSKYNKKQSAYVAVTVNPSDEFIKKILLVILISSNSMDQKLKIELMKLKVWV